ncbi:hypothetical protein [Micrococcus sp.]|uniref:hypothetical protein n=1 Tax=Micrococcus sp. TaxID=1271 RepID=UPI002A917A34|nr:hypothetical protein [Micrococcus sp.]MDY6056116.1 hypothetical protein [Micrococcus sp.]
MSAVNKPTIKRREPTGETRPVPNMSAAFPARSRQEVKNTSIDLPTDLHERLRFLAFTENTTMRQLIIDALEKTYPAT